MTTAVTAKPAAAAAGSSFYYAFLFLPPDKRAAITAFYSFCRAVDDIVDEVHEPQLAQHKLNWWAQEVRRLFADDPTHPISRALQPHLQRFDIRPPALLAVIDGCRMDLTQTRYADEAALSAYCHLVAGVVGEVAARIFGQSDVQTTRYAHTLGQAFQRTNIIRDVGEDALRGRIYLPLDALAAHQVSPDDVLARRDSANFRALMAEQARAAHLLYDQALQLLPAADRRAQKPGLAMASIYRSLLREIERSGFAVLQQRIALTPLRKLWLAWKTQAFGGLP